MVLTAVSGEVHCRMSTFLFHAFIEHPRTHFTINGYNLIFCIVPVVLLLLNFSSNLEMVNILQIVLDQEINIFYHVLNEICTYASEETSSKHHYMIICCFMFYVYICSMNEENDST